MLKDNEILQLLFSHFIYFFEILKFFRSILKIFCGFIKHCYIIISIKVLDDFFQIALKFLFRAIENYLKY